MLPEERMQKICDLVQEHGAVRVADLCKALNTSEATIRRDLVELNRQHRLRRTHGGAVMYYPVSQPGISRMSASVCAEEKKIIAQAALQYIEANDTIIMDCSTSTLELAKKLSTANLPVSIITNSVPILQLMGPLPNVTVIFIGGVVCRALNATCGYMAECFLQDLRADKAFVGISGIDPVYGFSTSNMEDAGLKAIMHEAAKSSYILADHTKFGKSYLSKIKCDFDYIITDTRNPQFPYEELNISSTIIFADEQNKS